MKKRKIQITIETAERWYNGCDRELKVLAVQTFPELEKKKLPKSWDDLNEIHGYWVDADSNIVLYNNSIWSKTQGCNRNVFATKEQAEASVALAQLSQLREVYRKGWVPDWSDEYKLKYCISFSENKIQDVNYFVTDCFLSFEDAETRDLFLENFRDLIEKAKPLMQ